MPSIHTEAMSCLDKAIQLAASRQPDDLRYACLQLRMSIEHLFYELLPHYKAELPTAVFDTWQPKQILDALIECNPDVTSDASLAIRDAEGKAVLFTGAQTAVSKKLLKENYHRLGAFLHAPMYGKGLILSDLVAAVEKAIRALESYRADGVILNHGKYVEVKCCACGHPYKRKVQTIPEDRRVRCLNSKCNALIRLNVVGGNIVPELAQVLFTCPACAGSYDVSETECRAGNAFACKLCNAQVIVREVLVLEKVSQ